MNKLFIESIKASPNIIPIDIYFIVKVGEHCHFSNIIQVTNQTQPCNFCIQYQMRDKLPLSLECWAYDQHLVTKPFFGKETISIASRRVSFQEIEILIRHSQQERSRTPDTAIKRDASPFGRRDLTPKRGGK